MRSSRGLLSRPWWTEVSGCSWGWHGESLLAGDRSAAQQQVAGPCLFASRACPIRLDKPPLRHAVGGSRRCGVLIVLESGDLPIPERPDVCLMIDKSAGHHLGERRHVGPTESLIRTLDEAVFLIC